MVEIPPKDMFMCQYASPNNVDRQTLTVTFELMCILWNRVMGTSVGAVINYIFIRSVIADKREMLDGTVEDPTGQWTGRKPEIFYSASVICESVQSLDVVELAILISILCICLNYTNYINRGSHWTHSVLCWSVPAYFGLKVMYERERSSRYDTIWYIQANTESCFGGFLLVSVYRLYHGSWQNDIQSFHGRTWVYHVEFNSGFLWFSPERCLAPQRKELNYYHSRFDS